MFDMGTHHGFHLAAGRTGEDRYTIFADGKALGTVREGRSKYHNDGFVYQRAWHGTLAEAAVHVVFATKEAQQS